MNAQHNPRPVSDAVSSSNQPPLRAEHVRTSTRILLDSPSRPECEGCENAIDHGTRYKCVTVQDRAGNVEELSFCGEDCLRKHDR